MGILYAGAVTPNKAGAQVYFPPRFVRQYGFPLTVDEGFVAQLLPHDAVLLVPAGATVEYPVTVPRPDRIDPSTDLSEFPIRCTTASTSTDDEPATDADSDGDPDSGFVFDHD